MSEAGTIKEFLFGLGWHVDTHSERQFHDTIRTATAQGTILGNVFTETAKKVGAAVKSMADSYAGLYYQSQQSKQSIASIKAFEYAAGQMGAEGEGLAALQTFAANKRIIGGGVAMSLKNMGVETSGRTDAQIIEDAVARTKDLPVAIAKQRLSFMGLSDQLIKDLRDNSGQFRGFESQWYSNAKAAGLDPEKLGRDAAKFEQAVGSFLNEINTLFASAASKLEGTGLIEKLNSFIREHAAEIRDGLEEIGKAFVHLVTFLVQHAPEIAAAIGRFDKWLAGSDPLNDSLDKTPDKISTFGTALKSLSEVTMPGWLKQLLGIGQAKAAESDAAGTGSGADGSSGSGAMNGGGSSGSLAGGGSGRSGGAGGGGGGTGTGDGSPYHADYSNGSNAPAGSLTSLITAEAKRAGINPNIMEGIRAGESGHGNKYDSKDDAIESSWGPFQLNRRRGLGVQFEKETGLDVRDPKTIPAQTRWVAEFLAKKYKANPNYNPGASAGGPWSGYRGNREADPKWGNSGLIVPKPEAPKVAVVPVPVPVAPKANPYGKLDTDALRNSFKSKPIGDQSSNWSHKNVKFAAATKIYVNGASDPHATARAIEGNQRKINSDYAGKAKESFA